MWDRLGASTSPTPRQAHQIPAERPAANASVVQPVTATIEPHFRSLKRIPRSGGRRVAQTKICTTNSDGMRSEGCDSDDLRRAGVLTHGSPSAFVEHLDPPLLSDPAAE
jgi:hypothetical protein